MFHWLIHTRCRRPLLWGAIAVACAAGCEAPGKPNPDEKPVMPDQLLDFDRLYANNCAGCHGATGQLGPAPPLDDALFVKIVPDELLLAVIRDGRAGTPMPAFARASGGSLTDAQVQALADGIKAKWKSDGGLPDSPPPYELTKSGASAAATGDRERGATVFARACAGCHGVDGAGIDVDGEMVNTIHVSAFLSLISDQAIRRIIITGRADLGMPNYAEREGRPDDFQPLTSAEIDDLVALLAAWRASGDSIVHTEP